MWWRDIFIFAPPTNFYCSLRSPPPRPASCSSFPGRAPALRHGGAATRLRLERHQLLEHLRHSVSQVLGDSTSSSLGHVPIPVESLFTRTPSAQNGNTAERLTYLSLSLPSLPSPSPPRPADSSGCASPPTTVRLSSFPGPSVARALREPPRLDPVVTQAPRVSPGSEPLPGLARSPATPPPPPTATVALCTEWRSVRARMSSKAALSARSTIAAPASRSKSTSLAAAVCCCCSRRANLSLSDESSDNRKLASASRCAQTP